MDGHLRHAAPATRERLELLRQGREVMRAVGGRRLDGEFCRLADQAPTRAALVEVLLACIARRAKMPRQGELSTCPDDDDR